MFSYTRTGIDVIEGKILLLGDIISQNMYVSYLHTYFRLYHPDRNIEFINMGICGETVSGVSEPNRPFPRPCLHNRLERILESIQPDWVISCYGMNDGIYHPLCDTFFKAFQDGYQSLIQQVHKIGAKIIVMTPPPFDSESFPGQFIHDNPSTYGHTNPYKHYDHVLTAYSTWILEQLCNAADITVDLHSALKQDIEGQRRINPSYLSGDGIHPNLHGHFVMANVLLREAFNIHTYYFEHIMKQDHHQLFELIHQMDCLSHHHRVETIGHDHPSKLPALEGEASEQAIESCNQSIAHYIAAHPNLNGYTDNWQGHQKKIFYFEGYEVTMVSPINIHDSNLWIWRTEFFGAFPIVDLAMLEQGYHLVHINLTDQYGSPQTIQIMKRFQDFICHNYQLNTQCILFGFSRGGLYARHYAAMFPQNVRSIYLDAPVVDIKSWPGGYGTGKGAPREWTHCRKLFSSLDDGIDGYTRLLESDLTHLMQAKIPVIIVAGDSDHVVPYEENGRMITDHYSTTQLPFKIILKEGGDHHPHSLDDPTEIVSFLRYY